MGNVKRLELLLTEFMRFHRIHVFIIPFYSPNFFILSSGMLSRDWCVACFWKCWSHMVSILSSRWCCAHSRLLIGTSIGVVIGSDVTVRGKYSLAVSAKRKKRENIFFISSAWKSVILKYLKCPRRKLLTQTSIGVVIDSGVTVRGVYLLAVSAKWKLKIYLFKFKSVKFCYLKTLKVVYP